MDMKNSINFILFLFIALSNPLVASQADKQITKMLEAPTETKKTK